jgi:hypothetical protein
MARKLFDYGWCQFCKRPTTSTQVSFDCLCSKFSCMSCKLLDSLRADLFSDLGPFCNYMWLENRNAVYEQLVLVADLGGEARFDEPLVFRKPGRRD